MKHHLQTYSDHSHLHLKQPGVKIEGDTEKEQAKNLLINLKAKHVNLIGGGKKMAINIIKEKCIGCGQSALRHALQDAFEFEPYSGNKLAK